MLLNIRQSQNLHRLTPLREMRVWCQQQRYNRAPPQCRYEKFWNLFIKPKQNWKQITFVGYCNPQQNTPIPTKIAAGWQRGRYPESCQLEIHRYRHWHGYQEKGKTIIILVLVPVYIVNFPVYLEISNGPGIFYCQGDTHDRALLQEGPGNTQPGKKWNIKMDRAALHWTLPGHKRGLISPRP